MSQVRTARVDTAHHHPRVRRTARGGWVWACACGGASCRTTLAGITWKQALVGALNHSSALAP